MDQGWLRRAENNVELARLMESYPRDGVCLELLPLSAGLFCLALTAALIFF